MSKRMITRILLGIVAAAVVLLIAYFQGQNKTKIYRVKGDNDMPKVYVVCDNSCKYESMTKEQILTAITQAVENGEVKDIDAGFITKLQEQNNKAALTVWIGTSAQYNAIEEKAENCLYILTDETTEEQIVETATMAFDCANAAHDRLNRFNKVLLEAEWVINSGEQVTTKLNDDVRQYSLIAINYNIYKETANGQRSTLFCSTLVYGRQLPDAAVSATGVANVWGGSYVNNELMCFFDLKYHTDGTVSIGLNTTTEEGTTSTFSYKITSIIGVVPTV